MTFRLNLKASCVGAVWAALSFAIICKTQISMCLAKEKSGGREERVASLLRFSPTRRMCWWKIIVFLWVLVKKSLRIAQHFLAYDCGCTGGEGKSHQQQQTSFLNMHKVCCFGCVGGVMLEHIFVPSRRRKSNERVGGSRWKRSKEIKLLSRHHPNERTDEMCCLCTRSHSFYLHPPLCELACI